MRRADFSNFYLNTPSIKKSMRVSVDHVCFTVSMSRVNGFTDN